MFSVLSSIFVLITASAAAFGAHPKVARDLENRKPDSSVDVIIQYLQTPTAAHHRKVTSKGGTHKQDLSLINSGLYSVPLKELSALANDPDVLHIFPDRAIHPTMDLAGPAVGADIARQGGWNGQGIAIAVVDSGISYHYDLSGSNIFDNRIVYQENFVVGDTDTADIYGHGTDVSGILAGNGWWSSGSKAKVTFRGIAEKAKLINLRVLNNSGVGTDSAVIAAIARAIQLKSTYNIRVLNLSVGRPVMESYKTDPLCQAVERAWNAGIVVVVAAGNNGRDNSQGTQGYGTINSPANDPYVITVGAMKTNGTPGKSDDTVASYSSKGPTLIDHIAKPDIVAPGNRIASILSGNSYLVKGFPANIVPWSYYTTSSTQSGSLAYFRQSGTSMAAPVVSGAAALLLQKDPTLTPDQVKARLMRTSSKIFPSMSTAVDPVTGNSYTSQYDLFTIGAGYLDVWAALNDTVMVHNLPARSGRFFSH